MEMGMPAINGYKPLFNYQGLLHEVVEQQLAIDRQKVQPARRGTRVGAGPVGQARAGLTVQIARPARPDGFVVPPARHATRVAD